MTQHYSGMSSRISDILEIIECIDVMDKQATKQRFWDMFVIDALIGNTDRNNGNWGFIVRGDRLELYPVYDCGACLNNKKSDNQLAELLERNNYKKLAYNFTTSLQDDNGKRVNPLHYIRDHSNGYMQEALRKLPADAESIKQMIYNVKPIISNIRVSWYVTMIELRLSFLNKCRTDVNVNPTDKFINAASILG